MKTIRANVFETNSSSAHCLVCSDDAKFKSFVDGELFADGGDYKFEYNADLIDLAEVYDRYENYIQGQENDAKRYQYEFDCTRVPVDVLKWFMLHPSIFPRFRLYESEAESGEPVPDNVQEFFDNHHECIVTLVGWLEDINSPYSYEMLKYNTDNFTAEYDGYQSYPPKSNNGKTELLAIWYY